MIESETALKKIAKGAGFFSIGLIIAKILSYIYRFIIARLGAEQYGLLSIAIAVFSMLTIFSLLGMGESVTRFVSFYKGKSDKRRIKGVITSTLKITLPFSLAFGISLFLLSDWVAVTFFHNVQLSLLFKVFAFAIPIDVLRSIFLNTFQAFQRVEYDVYAKSIAENATKVILTFLIIYLGFGIVSAAIVYVFAIFVSFVMSFYFMEKKVFPVFKTEITSIKDNKEILFYSLPLLLTGFVLSIIQWTDTLMLGYFRTIKEVGIYNVAWPVCTLLYLFPYAVRTLFVPVLSELYAQDKVEAFKSILRTVVKWITIVESLLLVLLVVYSQQVISILFGLEYVSDRVIFMGYNFALSTAALIILSFGRVLGDYLAPAKDALMVIKKTKLLFLNTMVGAGMNVLLNYLLIPIYGIIGAAIATGFAYLLIAALHASQIYCITKINPFKSNSIKALVISFSILILMILFKFYTITNIFYLIITCIIIAGVYFVLLLITRTFEREDVKIFKAVEYKLNINTGISKLLDRFT